MKWYSYIVYALLLLSASKLYAIDIITDTDHATDKAIKNLLNNFSVVILEYCNFNPDMPINVPLSGSELIKWMEQENEEGDTRQYLLLKYHYAIDQNIEIVYKSKFCGLSDWLISGIFALSEFLSINNSFNTNDSDDYFEASGDMPRNFSNSGYDQGESFIRTVMQYREA